MNQRVVWHKRNGRANFQWLRIYPKVDRLGPKTKIKIIGQTENLRAWNTLTQHYLVCVLCLISKGLLRVNSEVVRREESKSKETMQTSTMSGVYRQPDLYE